MKQCSKCHIEKPENEFFKSGYGDSLRSECKVCSKLMQEKYRPVKGKQFRPYVDENGVRVRKCRSCLTVKPTTEYYTRAGHLSARCIECDLKDKKARYDEDPKRFRDSVARSYRKNPAKRQAYHRVYIEKNHDKMIERCRAYNESHREERRAYDRIRHSLETPAFRRADRERRKEYFRKYSREYRLAHPDILWNAKQRRRQGERMNFERIIRKDVIERDNSICYLCGVTCVEGVNLTLDHVIPISRGGPHRMENMRVACKPCNSAKHNKTLEEYQVYLAALEH